MPTPKLASLSKALLDSVLVFNIGEGNIFSCNNSNLFLTSKIMQIFDQTGTATAMLSHVQLLIELNLLSANYEDSFHGTHYLAKKF